MFFAVILVTLLTGAVITEFEKDILFFLYYKLYCKQADSSNGMR